MKKIKSNRRSSKKSETGFFVKLKNLSRLFILGFVLSVIFIFSVSTNFRNHTDEFFLSKGFYITDIAIYGNSSIKAEKLAQCIYSSVFFLNTNSSENDLEKDINSIDSKNNLKKDFKKEMEDFFDSLSLNDSASDDFYSADQKNSTNTKSAKSNKNPSSVLVNSSSRDFNKNNNISKKTKSGIGKYINDELNDQESSFSNKNNSKSDSDVLESKNLDDKSSTNTNQPNNDLGPLFLVKNGIHTYNVEKSVEKPNSFLNSKNFKSSVMLDLNAIFVELNNLKLIKNITIKKAMPSLLMIKIEEYQPVAIVFFVKDRTELRQSRNKILHYISFLKNPEKHSEICSEKEINVLTKCGKVIAVSIDLINGNILTKLPFILVCEKDIIHFQNKIQDIDIILSNLHSFPILHNKNKVLFVLEFLPSYRWDLIFYTSDNYKSGGTHKATLIKFSRSKLRDSIENFSKCFTEISQLDDISIVDLRFDNQVIIVPRS
jgi:hypothetical protein